MADLHDTIVRLKSYANTTRNVVLVRRKTIEEAVDLLKEQQAIIDELLKVGYPHNFQREKPWIVNYMLKITEVVKKAVHLRNGAKGGEQE